MHIFFKERLIFVTQWKIVLRLIDECCKRFLNAR